MVNKKIVLLILIAITLGLGIYLSLQQDNKAPGGPVKDITNKPAPVEIKSEIQANNNALNLSEYSFRAINEKTTFTPDPLPEKLPVYQYTPSSFITKENINKISNYFKIGDLKETNSPVQGLIVYASNNSASISSEISNHKLSMHFFGKNIETLETFDGLDPQVSINRAKTILQQQLGLNTDKFSNVKYAYVVYEEVRWKPVNDQASANRIQVIFEATTPNNYPLIDKSFSLTPNIARVTLTPQGYPVDIYVEDFGEIKPLVGEEVAVKSKQTVLQEINDGKAKIINTNTIATASNPVTITVRSVSLGYTKDKDKLIPVFTALGTAKFDDPNNNSAPVAEIELLVPATY